MNFITQNIFPVNSLPSIFLEAVNEACSITKVPTPLAAGLAFTSAAVACQGHIRVRTPFGTESPVSLFCVHVAKSGERKSTVEKLFLRGIREFQTFHLNRIAATASKHALEKSIWTQEFEVLSKKLQKAKDSDHEDAPQCLARLQAHDAERPKDAPTPKVFFSDTTPESLVQKLATGWPSGILQSSEASIVLAGHAAKNLGFLNTLWDGDEIDVDRRNGESFVVRDAQLSASLMVQPGVIQRFISKNNGMARDVGFLARCLICAPESTQGTRIATGLEPESSKNLDKFTEMTRQILRGYYSDDGVLCSERIVLEFSPEAVIFWRIFYNSLESRLGPGGYYSDIADFASKVGENIVRLAAIFHVMDGNQGNTIDRATVERAINIGGWYLNEFKRLLGEPQQLSEEFSNARLLEKWLLVKANERRTNCLPKSEILTYGPNRLRKKNALDAALNQLVTECKIEIFLHGKKHLVNLNPVYFGKNHFLEPPRPLFQPIKSLIW